MKSTRTWTVLTALAAAATCAGLALCATGKAATDNAPQAASRPAELKVLDILVGDWDHAMSVTPGEDKSKETRITGTFSRKWALGDQFVQETGSYSDGTKALVLFGYDREKKAYRIWWFNSSGTAFDSLMQWDEATKTMTGKVDHSHGISTFWTFHLIDKDTHEWKTVVKDASDKILVEAGGKCTRKK